jgi:hypothetical protein
MRLRSFLVSMVRGAAILAVFCGLGAAQTGIVPTSACSLISKPEVSEISSVPVSDGRALVGSKDVSVCWFALPGGGRIAILARIHPTREWAAAESARMRTGAGYRPVRIGADQAFLYRARNGGATACIFAAGLYLQVSVFGLRNAADNSGTVERLSSRILGRIDGPGRPIRIAGLARGK